jgi:NADH:ubiquinone oxidoreductase subunit 3 (subunit A)
LEALWYILGFAFAGVSFVFLTIAAAWLISHRNRGDEHKGLPYESGIDTYGDTHGRFGLPSTSMRCCSWRSTSR